MSTWWIQVVGLVVVWLSVVIAEEYPTCGTCWCVPDNNGTASCPTDWQPATTFSPIVISSYLQQKPASIYRLNCNPYQDETCTTTPVQSHLNEDDAVCAYKYPTLSDDSQACSGYQMITYANQEDALADQAVLTHKGSCGLCSTTQDLAIYLSKLSPLF